MAEPLADDQIQAALEELGGWVHEDGALMSGFEFESFGDAISFIVRVAFEADKHDHHPDIYNGYNQVELALTTHDAGDRVTQKDLDLARAIDALI